MSPPNAPTRWHIPAFLAPAILIYTIIMVVPLAETLRLSFYRGSDGWVTYTALANFTTLFHDPEWSEPFWSAFRHNLVFFAVHMIVQNPIGILLAALLSINKLPGAGAYRTVLFLPTMLSFVIVGFIWKLILSPLWGVTPSLLDLVGLKQFFAPWLGNETSALVTVALISVWQYIGIPMMLTYAALLNIPREITEAASVDGMTGLSTFFKIRLPLLWPTLGIVSIMTFVANFNAFDLIYVTQGALAGPNFSTDILGTLLFRTFFGFQLQPGNPTMGATIATIVFGFIMTVVCCYLFTIQRRIARHAF